MAMLSSVADQGLKLAKGTGKAAWSAGATCLSVADKGYQVVPGIAWKLARSTGKAAWIAATSAIVLVLPIMLVMDSEHTDAQVLQEQITLLGPGHP